MSVCSRPTPNCSECGDTLIHQSNRGPHESSSAFGQYVHDRGQQEKEQGQEGPWSKIYWMDVDGAIFKLQTSILRIIEHKPVGGDLSNGQKEVLPLLAKAVQLLAATGLVHRDSGVFVHHSDPPYDTAAIKQQRGWPRIRVWNDVKLSGPPLESFLQGEQIEDP